VTVPAPRKGAKPKRLGTRSATRSLRAGQRATLTLKLKLSKALHRQISRALATRRTRNGVRVAVKATATDAAGNRQTKSRTVRLRR
jgi:hypothetical protein